ncbi:cytochrome P450 [Streptomyces sp. JW3]|uniref:cytochrome P450 n=1 Tax=Streptomyces sp. JW3 TaxID=3456955 RepID=UPI003FA476DE
MPKPPDLPPHLRRDGLDPLPELSRMSNETPVCPDPGAADWLATGRAEARAILGDADRFTAKPPDLERAISRGAREEGNLLHYDPPEHTRLRKLIAPEFTLRRMRRMEPIVEQIVAERLDVLAAAGSPADLMRHFGWPVPGLVICALLGIPRDDLADLGRMLDVRAPSRMDAHSTGRTRKRVAAQKAFASYMSRIVAQKRRDPGEDMLGMLIREHGDDVTDAELAGVCASFMAAGLEGSAQMLGLGLLALLQHPGQLALLRADPALLPRAVEELLRYVSVVSTASPRTALTDVTVGGELIKKGQVVSCSLLAVNRTRPAGLPPDRLDITREDTGHVAFGHGIHYCVGAALARAQLRLSFAALLSRFPGLRLAVPVDDLRFRQFAVQYGVEELPVAW